MGNDTSTLSAANKEEFRIDNDHSNRAPVEEDNNDDDNSSTASNLHLREAKASTMLTGRLRSDRSAYAKSVSSNVSVNDMNPYNNGADDAASDTSSTPEKDRAEKGCCQSTRDSLNGFRNACGALVNDGRVQLVVVLLITINAILMGVATFEFVRGNPQVHHIFEITDLAFLIFFTVELVMQIIYHGYYLFYDGWLVFDFLIIVMSWSLSGVQVIRAFRIFRALRLITRVKVMKNLILALFSVMPRMVAIFMMLGLLFYIFGVMFTQLFKDLYSEGVTEFDYFSRMDHTFLTLFQLMTLDGWGELTREITSQTEYSWAVMPMVLFVILSGFIVANLFIAVICDAVSALREEQKDNLRGWKPKKRRKKNPAIGDATFGDGRNLLKPAMPTQTVTFDEHNIAASSSSGMTMPVPSPSGELGYVNMSSFDRPVRSSPPPPPIPQVPSNLSREESEFEDATVVDLRDQIENVEDRIEELTRMQETTFLMLKRMSDVLQERKADAMEANNKTDDTDGTISSGSVA